MAPLNILHLLQSQRAEKRQMRRKGGCATFYDSSNEQSDFSMKSQFTNFPLLRAHQTQREFSPFSPRFDIRESRCNDVCIENNKIGKLELRGFPHGFEIGPKNVPASGFPVRCNNNSFLFYFSRVRSLGNVDRHNEEKLSNDRVYNNLWT